MLFQKSLCYFPHFTNTTDGSVNVIVIGCGLHLHSPPAELRRMATIYWKSLTVCMLDFEKQCDIVGTVPRTCRRREYLGHQSLTSDECEEVTSYVFISFSLLHQPTGSINFD